MKTELKIFLTALMFYTRFPIKKIDGWNETMLNKSTRYFTLIGLIVGGVGAGVFLVAVNFLPFRVAVVLSMVSTIFFTGAFHEDGFADFCDGFGGGTSQPRILEIMKDSRIGTYGTVGLILILAMKFFTLSELGMKELPVIMIAGHAVSRVFPVLLIYSSSYVRSDLNSKAKPVGHADSKLTLIVAVVTGGVSVLFLSWQAALVIFVVLIILFLIFRNYVNRKLGGYTGDVLGALQQLSELFFYLAVLGCRNI